MILIYFVVCRYFSKIDFWKNSLMNIIRVSNSLDPDQARHFVGPDLGPNCLQRSSADESTKVFVCYIDRRLSHLTIYVYREKDSSFISGQQ